MAFVRDLAVRLRAIDEGLTLALERANKQAHELVGGFRAASAEIVAFQRVGRGLYGATGVGLGLLGENLAYLRRELQAVGPALGGLALSGFWFLERAAQASAQAEWAMVRAQQLVGKAWTDLFTALEAQQRKWRGAFNISDVLEEMIPVLAVLGEKSNLVIPALDAINQRIVMMGGGAEAARRAWLYIAQAITTGSAEILMKASRFLPFPLIQGEKAIAIAKRMKREYDDLTNAMILFKALTASTALEQEKLSRVMDTARFQAMRFSATWQEFMERFGVGAREVKAKTQGWLADVLERFTALGGAEPFGRWFQWFTGIAGVLGFGKLAGWILGKLGIPLTVGGVLGALGTVVGWVAFAGALALIIQDVLSQDSVIKKLPETIDSLLTKFGAAIQDWVESIFKGKKATEDYVATLKETNEKFRTYAEFLAEKVGIPEKELQGFRTKELIPKTEELAAKWFYYEAQMATGLPLGLPPEIAKWPWPDIAAAVFGPRWQEYMAKYTAGEMSMVQILRDAIAWMETGANELDPLYYAALRYWRDTGYLAEVKRRLDELEGIPTGPKPEPGAFAPPGWSFAPTVTVESGAVNVQITLPSGFAPNWRDVVIEQTLKAIEAQLRAVLEEQPHPGVGE